MDGFSIFLYLLSILMAAVSVIIRIFIGITYENRVSGNRADSLEFSVQRVLKFSTLIILSYLFLTFTYLYIINNVVQLDWQKTSMIKISIWGLIASYSLVFALIESFINSPKEGNY